MALNTNQKIAAGAVGATVLVVAAFFAGRQAAPSLPDSPVAATEQQGNIVDRNGANVADEVARGDFCEATIGASDKQTGELFHKLFDMKTFSVNTVDEVASVELCGALKNVVRLRS